MKAVLTKKSEKIQDNLINFEYIKQAVLQHNLQTLCFNAGLDLQNPAFACERYHLVKENRAPVHLEDWTLLRTKVENKQH